MENVPQLLQTVFEMQPIDRYSRIASANLVRIDKAYDVLTAHEERLMPEILDYISHVNRRVCKSDKKR